MRRAGLGRAREARRSSSSSRTWTWSASATRRARTTRARAGSTSSSTATGCAPTGRRWARTTGSGSRQPWPSRRTPRSRTGRSSSSSPCREEEGLEGAKALDAALVSGRLLVNLDGTSDASLTIGCAGSAHTFVRVPLDPEPVPTGDSCSVISLRRARRALGRRHRQGTRERDQGARPRARGDARSARASRRRRQPECASARGARDRRRFGGDEAAFRGPLRATLAAIAREYASSDEGSALDRAAGRRAQRPASTRARALDLLPSFRAASSR